MLAIHKNNLSFSKRWIEYCKKFQVPYKSVNGFSNNDREIIFNSKGFMWHWLHNSFPDKLIAKGIINSCEIKGIKTFPNMETCNHYDNKIYQQFLFESLKIPCPKGFVFTDLESTKDWLKDAKFPFVFKLSSGAGSSNVKLIHSKEEALKLANVMFKKGKDAYPRIHNLSDSLYKFNKNDLKNSLFSIIKGTGRYFYKNKKLDELGKEKNYFFVQEFIPNNLFDHRIIIIGEKAVCLQRGVREKDFRASGSGMLTGDPEAFPAESINLAFKSANALKMQCAAFDIVYGKNCKPLIVEVSYCFSSDAYLEHCHGYFDRDLNWHPSIIYLEDMIMEEFLKELK